MDTIKQILIVEDDSSIREMLVDVLSDNQKYSLVTTNTGENALVLLQSSSFDLVILDLGLPVMDGNELLAQLALIGSTVPVIVASANPQELRPTAQVKRVIAKPFDIDQLLDTVEEILNQDVITLKINNSEIEII